MATPSSSNLGKKCAIAILSTLTAQEVQEALANYCANRKVAIEPSAVDAANRFKISIDPSEVFVCYAPALLDPLPPTSSSAERRVSLRASSKSISEAKEDDPKRLIEIIGQKDEEIRNLETSSSKALASIQTFHKQQQALFDEFVLLRQKYDEQKLSLINVLWLQCAQFHPELKQIPVVEDESSFIETDNRVGDFVIGQTLGEGQFAQVKTCWKEGDSTVYAVKIINKERIATFSSLRRVSNEVEVLRKLKSPYVISIECVIQTNTKLYIVTEKGGADLFEFFDEHPYGVMGAWAKEIISHVLKGVLYIHDHNVCHRDLKPENLLLEFDPATEKCKDVKICDFGLSTKFKHKVLLTDFCGSPGFFAPEMIIHGSYFGDKADIWSLGCTLLELVLGHEKFCDSWMTAYDYEILQDKAAFTEEMQSTVTNLQAVLNFPPDLNDFILRCLSLKSGERPSAKQLCAHPWLAGTVVAPPVTLMQIDTSMGSPGHNSASSAGSGYGAGVMTPGAISVSTSVPSPGVSGMFSPSMLKISPAQQEQITEALRDIYVEDRERKHIEEYQQHHMESSGDEGGSSGTAEKGHTLHLPPIEPMTPSVGKARKILSKGDELVQKATSGTWTPLGASGDNLNISANSAAKSPKLAQLPAASGASGNNGSKAVGSLPLVAEDPGENLKTKTLTSIRDDDSKDGSSSGLMFSASGSSLK